MPRILKADLRCQVDVLTEKLEEVRGEYAALRRECGRSRSPRRITESAATSRRAWDLVCRAERDEVVHEQRETIARQKKEIESLKRGEGQMWPILLARWESRGTTMSDGTNMGDFIRERIAGKGTTVINFVDRVERIISQMSDIAAWGTSMYDGDTSGVAFAAARVRGNA